MDKPNASGLKPTSLHALNVNRPLHVLARSERNQVYVKQRANVPDALVPWATSWVDYQPVEFTHESVAKQPAWADPSNPLTIRGLTSRLSYEMQPLVLDKNGRPLNPFGRTGTSGRGLLGKWGPNHAADPIVMRAQPAGGAGAGEYEMVAIKRRDTGQWAIPGGMVDEGEVVSATLRREFSEEAAAITDPVQQRATAVALDEVFQHGGAVVYQGYVDDPRNTDHAWMETAVHLFLLDDELAERLPLKSGSDAAAVQWLPLDSKLLGGKGGQSELYADHAHFVKLALDKAKKLRSERRTGSKV